MLNMGRRLKNPSPIVVVGTLGALGLIGYAGYEYMSEAKAAKPKTKKNGKKTVTCPDGTVLDKDGECVAKKPAPEPSDNWGTGMTASTQALNEGVPVKIFKDAEGRWNFGYSWKTRKEGPGKGALWNWLRAGDPEYDTLIVMYGAETPVEAYTRVGQWMKNLNSLVKLFSENTNLEPGHILRTQGSDLTPYYIRGRDVWGTIGPVPKGEGTTRFLEDPMEWWYINNFGSLSSQSGCCYTAMEASDNLRS